MLTRDLGLESDAATLLMAAGAEVQTASPGAKPTWQPVGSFLGAPGKPAPGEVVIAIRLPAVKPGDSFWSFKVNTSPCFPVQRSWPSTEDDESRFCRMRDRA